MTSKLEIRHKQRQDEIINAARRCFRRCGFHAASMSQIASEAQLSVGQIYRYFANKDAIIEEMVRRIIDFRIAQMDIDARTDHFPEVLALRKSLNEDDDALMLEVAAEATRNPRVMAMLEEADARMFANGCAHMKRMHPHISDEHIRCCVEVFATMMEGTVYRRLTPQKSDPQHLQEIYQDIVSMLINK